MTLKFNYLEKAGKNTPLYACLECNDIRNSIFRPIKIMKNKGALKKYWD